jgi:cystathionine beta-lyase
LNADPRPATLLVMSLKPDRPLRDPAPNAGFETLCVHFGDERAAWQGAAAPPIYQTSTFVYPDAAAFAARRTPGSPHYDYTRVGNPTNALLEAKIARLEGADWCYGVSSGMAAISAAVNACVEAGAHVVAHAHSYGPTRAYLHHLRRLGVETTFVNVTDPRAILAAASEKTRLIYLESPTSGFMEIVEIEPIARAARQRGIATIFDNSWASPYFQRPLEMSVDLVVHSATKYINGHSDVVAGVVAGRGGPLHERVAAEIELAGATLDPFAGWLMTRGLRTLALRMEQHQRSGLALARMLVEHPAVLNVRHPGLPSHPQHALARRQMRGYAGLFSFALREQTREAAHRVLDRLRLFHMGVSWGGHESLAIGGTFFSTASEPKQWLIRVFAGLESTDDLVADMRQALEA